MARKLALLVGINKYPGAALAGCVNDVLNIRDRLIKDYGFRLEDIVILIDGAATTKAILERLNWLVKDAKAGDTLLFWYSGHGAQVPTSSGNEPDGMAEVICPVDFDWSMQKMITDDQFAAIFGTLPQGVIFNWGSDSCHSGDLTKAMPTAKDRSGWWHSIKKWVGLAPGKPLIKARQMPSTWMPLGMSMELRRVKAKGIASRGFVGGILDVGFVSGCMANQTSADTEMEGRPCGAMTYYFLKDLSKTATLRDVVKAMNTDLARGGYGQRPSCEGTRADKPFLGA